MRVWPKSLVGRTALALVLGLMVVQAGGLTLYAFDRIDLQHYGQWRDVAISAASIYKAVAQAPTDQRETSVAEMDRTLGPTVSLANSPPVPDFTGTGHFALDWAKPEMLRALRIEANFVPIPLALHWKELDALGSLSAGRIVMAFRLPAPEGTWLIIDSLVPPRHLWSARFLGSFLLMTAAAAALSVWAARRLATPVRMLAEAAEALGRDVNAPPMNERGPSEVATAAVAFNTMADRIRRFVRDRTDMLTAIGHDLRTPITRLKLRAEFMEDEEQRRKVLGDLDEMEAMVAATLAFGRDAARAEGVAPLDLVALLRTVVDEAADAAPDHANAIGYSGPEHLTIRARPLGLKRAFTNLVANAVKYGGSAQVHLAPPEAGLIRIEIDDHGPGVPASELERIFEPFHRLEASRNRETGGTGLGLPIARDILRAHGGDVTLANRSVGGARVLVLLPV